MTEFLSRANTGNVKVATTSQLNVKLNILVKCFSWDAFYLFVDSLVYLNVYFVMYDCNVVVLD